MTTTEAPQKLKSRILTVTLPTVLYLIVFIVNIFIPIINNITPTQRMWIFTELAFFIAAIIVLIKNGLPSRNYSIISAILATLVLFAYYVSFFMSVISFVVVFICSAAAFSIFKNYPEKKIKVIHSKSNKGILITLAISLVVGGILGTINLFQSHEPIRPDVNISCFLLAISPGILEEVVFRLFPFALILFFLHGTIRTRFEAFFVYVFMIIPHAIMHTPDIMLEQGPLYGLITALMLSILFGLPFALLMRKRDLTSAMVSHWFVDLIRFIFIGLPM